MFELFRIMTGYGMWVVLCNRHPLSCTHSPHRSKLFLKSKIPPKVENNSATLPVCVWANLCCEV